jgi:hypothetical protein
VLHKGKLFLILEGPDAFRQPYEIQDIRDSFSTHRPVSYSQVKTTSFWIGSSFYGFLFGDEKRYETKVADPNSGYSRDILDWHSISRKVI